WCIPQSRICGDELKRPTAFVASSGGSGPERLNVLGASEVINYTETPDWDVKARELTDGRGVDCVVEIGGPGTIAKSLKALPWADISA
ncbi:MAG TPA: zinc-binding dehydrogenase, partial [Stellaceae bacterium]|nr:zinc-binding dehydrogenase [Stellaceae bacterium]